MSFNEKLLCPFGRKLLCPVRRSLYVLLVGILYVLLWHALELKKKKKRSERPLCLFTRSHYHVFTCSCCTRLFTSSSAVVLYNT